jgi:diguanylate cyclase (GGDEF)-like protein/PAS domain S-box-containing protein
MILVHTNDFHHLFYESVGLREDAPFTMVEHVKGKWYLFYMGYTMACFILSISILFVKLRRASYPYNMQIISLLLGIFIPVVGIFIYQTGGSPFGIDIGPLLGSISYLFFGLAFISFKMLNVGPIAKDKVFDSMQDGVIVLNHLNRVVDYNLAATKVIPTLDHNSIGRNIDDLIVSLPHFQNHLHLFHSKEVTEELSIEEGGSLFHYQIKFSPVMDNDKKEIGHIFQFIDITEKVIIQNELKRLATIDGLTNIANRTYFLEKCELYIKKAKDKEVNVSLVMFDIDHFKSINDTYGHSAGDKVIQYVVNKANMFLRDEDIIGRYGGEEFMLFLPNTNHRQSVELAENIKREIENSHVPVDNKKISVTCSLGITTYLLNKQTPIPLALLIKNADEALYCAKKNGRNRVEHYDLGELKKEKSFQ